MPESFELTADQLAAAHQLAGIEQAEFGHPPAPDVLAATGVLADDGQTLKPTVDAALRVVRDPAVLVQAVANRAGEPVWTQAWVAIAPEGPAVVQTQTETANVYRAVDDPTQVAAALAEATGQPAAGGSAAGLPTLPLDLAGFAALVALVDAVQTESLRARLDRRPVDPRHAVGIDALAEQLERGASAIDSTWLVTAALPITPVDLRSTADRLGDGVSELVRAGLVADPGDGKVVTPAGLAVLASLGATATTLGCYFPHTGPDGQPTLDHVAVLGGPDTTWTARWSHVTATHATVELRPGSAEQGAEAVASLLGRARDAALAARAAAAAAAEAARAEQERIAAEQRAAEQAAQAAMAAQAEQARAEQERIAAQQLADQQAAAAGASSWQQEAPPAVESMPLPAVDSAGAAPTPPEPIAEAAPASGWAPTHRVPAVGMWAWNEPDPTAQPAAALDPHLEVQATDHRGEWVHILCSNGWAAWVDGRQLVAR
jgi:hypothetical protein